VGGLRLAVETEKAQSQKNAHKTHRVPTCPLHALLGCLDDEILFIKLSSDCFSEFCPEGKISLQKDDMMSVMY
jgi:hypothetical protein